MTADDARLELAELLPKHVVALIERTACVARSEGLRLEKVGVPGHYWRGRGPALDPCIMFVAGTRIELTMVLGNDIVFRMR